MNDSQFAVVTFLLSVLLAAAVGAAAAYVTMQGTHECSVELDFGGQRTVFLTECRL